MVAQDNKGRIKADIKGSTPGRVFISNASADKGLVDAFVNLLRVGLDLGEDDIFCSSIEGLGVPIGEDFIDYIKKNLENSGAVIPIITPCYLASVFCIAELGASWIRADKTFPLISPPLTYDEVKGVLETTQLGKMDDSDNLGSLRDLVCRAINKRLTRTSTWDGARKRFLKELEDIIPRIRIPDTVSRAEFTKLEEDYNGAVEEIAKLQSEISKKDALVDRLKACKDATEVEAVVLKGSDELERFDNLIYTSNRALNKLPSIVQEAVFYHFYGGRLDQDSCDYTKVTDAIERGFLYSDDWGFVKANTEDPLVLKAINKVDELDSFIETELSPDLAGAFVRYYNYEPSVSNKRFWEDLLTARRYNLGSFLRD